MSNELELQELIREVAKAKATFLRVPPRDVKRTLYERRPRVESTSTFLSSVERHLLDVYREELARTLNMLCLQQLYSSSRRIPHFRSVTLHRGVDVPQVEETSRRVEASLRRTPRNLDRGTDEALALLKQCVTGEPRAQPSVSQLASASHRVAPSDQARIYFSLDLWEIGQTEESLAALGSLLASCSSALAISASFENIGCILAALRKFTESICAFQKALMAYDLKLNALVSLFALFCQVAHEHEAVCVGSRIDELIDPSHSIMKSLVDSMSKARQRGIWMPTRESRSTINRIEDRVGPTARSILSVFAY